MSRVYLDHNASSPLRPEAREAMVAAMAAVGNPSSIHAEGRAARAIVEGAREKIAGIFGVSPGDIVFTSGGTEAAAAALAMAAGHMQRAGHGAIRTIVSAIEHACVLSNAPEGSAVLPVDDRGWIDARSLELELSKGPAIVAIQDANNETGFLQTPLSLTPLQKSEALHIYDMAQTAGRFSNETFGAIAFISAHKFGGPKGAGAVLWPGDDLGDAPVAPLMRGGGQERGRRAGTENVVAIAGMTAALEASTRDRGNFTMWARSAQRKLDDGVREIAPDTVVFGGGFRTANTTCFAAPGVPAEIALAALDLEGVAVSSGSACSSGKVAPSHVLAAMGVAPELAKCAIRVSTGWNSTDADIERFLDVWQKVYRRLRPRASA